MGKHYNHLSYEERSLIQLSLERDCSLGDIAKSLGRSRSTISRELARNGWSNPAARVQQLGRPPVAGGYRSTSAQQRAKTQSAKARKPKRLLEDSELWKSVEHLLRDYVMPRGSLRSELIGYLRQSRKSRRPRTRGEDRGVKPQTWSVFMSVL